ncbi:MAG TPA: hypothetical protein VE890_14880 [Thermoguttaceae bacterium]|nr:hypothetical protein [Thermoguttaceae bacterium]
MSTAGIQPGRGETARGEPSSQADLTGRIAAEMAACCGPDMAKMMHSCPCASAMKGRWKTALVVCGLILLAFIVCQIGGILGWIAFFRTL